MEDYFKNMKLLYAMARLMGTNVVPTQTQQEAQKDRPHPQDSEVEAARSSGLMPYYGAPGGQGQKTLDPGMALTFDKLFEKIRKGDTVTKTDPKYANARDRAAMAASRNPILKMGVEGADVTYMDVPNDAKYNFGGVYQPNIDKVYADPRDNSTTHELMHRGFKRMSDLGFETPKGGEEELFVRKMMDMYRNDEMGGGPLNDKQIGEARKFFTNKENAARLQKMLDLVERYQADMRSEDWSYRGENTSQANWRKK